MAIYHSVLRNDLMRRVIHPAIYAAYQNPGPDFIDRPHSAERFPSGSWEIPLEFSHGAPQADDIAILVVRYEGGPTPSPAPARTAAAGSVATD